MKNYMLVLFGHIAEFAVLCKCGLLLQTELRGLPVSLSWLWALQNRQNWSICIRLWTQVGPRKYVL